MLNEVGSLWHKPLGSIATQHRFLSSDLYDLKLVSPRTLECVDIGHLVILLLWEKSLLLILLQRIISYAYI
jgi:hypothetical protein